MKKTISRAGVRVSSTRPSTGSTATRTRVSRSTKSERQIPRIMKSTLMKPHSWFVVTRYDIKRAMPVTGPGAGVPGHYLVAREKFDVTDQMTAILKAERVVKKRRTA